MNEDLTQLTQRTGLDHRVRQLRAALTLVALEELPDHHVGVARGDRPRLDRQVTVARRAVPTLAGLLDDDHHLFRIVVEGQNLADVAVERTGEGACPVLAPFFARDGDGVPRALHRDLLVAGPEDPELSLGELGQIERGGIVLADEHGVGAVLGVRRAVSRLPGSLAGPHHGADQEQHRDRARDPIPLSHHARSPSDRTVVCGGGPSSRVRLHCTARARSVPRKTPGPNTERPATRLIRGRPAAIGVRYRPARHADRHARAGRRRTLAPR